MDAANSDDLALVGDGLLSYYGVTHSAEALQAAEGLAHYFVTEMAPHTSQGAWSAGRARRQVGSTEGSAACAHHASG